MTLATHAVVGAAFAELFPSHPIAAFVAGFASHLAIDSLPHWDYGIRSLEESNTDPLDKDMAFNRKFVGDLLRIGSDALLGIILSLTLFFYAFHTATVAIIIIGAIAGILPDPLQFAYWKTRSAILLPLQRFHVWLQEGKRLYVTPLVGLSLQLALVIVIVAASVYIRTHFI